MHVRSRVARSILAFNLVVDDCSGVLSMVYRGLDFGGFAELNLFCGATSMEILRSVDVDQVVFVSVLVDGAENLE